ncbi:MAG TPA: hypothetical protein DEA08_02080 [Planctomycetes bacterium]|nr:hypothetical protein [Planctomycetota bacterium]
MSYDYDAIVIGAGPAGTSVSLHLARQGRSVLLVDGARFPRRKVCGEGIMPHGLAALRELGLEPKGQPFTGLRYVLEDGTHAESRFPGDLAGLGVQRSWLDDRLVRLARDEPRIDLRLGTWVQEIELGDPDAVRVRLGGETLSAPVLIGADGGRSRIRRLAGLDAPVPRRPRFGVGAHVRHEPNPDPRVEVSLHQGYEVYTTPVASDLTCVALLTDREGLRPLQGDLEGGLRAILRQDGGRARAWAEAPMVGSVRAIGPLALRSTRAHAPRLLLVGDAAGALDPITGEGISLALVTARIASEVLASAYARGDFSARQLASWTRRRGEAIRGLERFTSALLFLSERPRHARRVVRSLSKSPDTFGRLLGIAAGSAPLSSLRLVDGYRLLVG